MGLFASRDFKSKLLVCLPITTCNNNTEASSSNHRYYIINIVDFLVLNLLFGSQVVFLLFTLFFSRTKFKLSNVVNVEFFFNESLYTVGRILYDLISFHKRAAVNVTRWLFFG